MKKKIAVLPGDGIGPEIMEEAVKVLVRVGEVFNHDFVFEEALIGGAAYEKFGAHFPKETVKVCEGADAILFGSVGGPSSERDVEKWKDCEINSILAIRKHFGFSVNLRPVRLYDCLSDFCVLKVKVIADGVDILCVRELSSGIYFGKHEMGDGHAVDEMKYSGEEIEVVARIAFEAAMKRRKKVSSVDKANVLSCGKLWREVVEKVARDFKDVEVEHIFVDNAAMQVIRRPSDFDVILCPNMFGDIISDELSVLAGSLGMLPSASIAADGFAMYEPSGGSAPDIAGEGLANPIGQILSAGMMLRYSFKMDKEYEAVMRAVDTALADGLRTKDIAGEEHTFVSTDAMGDSITHLITK